MSKTLDWNDQRAFLAVVDTGSLSAAARRLGVAQATVRTASARSAEIAGIVRISVSEFIGVEVLPAMLVELRGQYPRLILEIELSNTSAAILDRETDVAVRRHQPQQGSLIARSLLAS